MTHTATIAGLDGRALWYLSRGTGAVSLVLLTISVVLGVVNVRQWSSPRVPRFVVDGLHGTVSLLVLATLAVHIVTSVLDPFAPIRLVDAVLPFGSGYRPVWLGLGALALDLLIALVLTSLLRARLGYRGWRAVHWLAYACWPIALIHGLGTGSDVRGGFMLPLSVACAVAVAIAVAARLGSGATQRVAWRAGGLAILAAAGVALVLWLPSGPLAQGWAARAGTPRSALTAATSSRAAQKRTQAASAPAPTATQASLPAQTSLHGRISQAVSPDGTATIKLPLALQRGSLRRLVVELRGTALAGGGVSLNSGEVTLGTPARPDVYTGSVNSLQGGNLDATLTAPEAPSVDLALTLQIDRASGSVDGTAAFTQAGAG
jgi:sulfoxide reductase heme-binding subunit YedZ